MEMGARPDVTAGGMDGYAPAPAPMAMEQEMAMGAPAAPVAVREAKLGPQATAALPAGAAPTAGPATQSPPPEATDGRAGPLLVYEARLQMAVYKVDEIQRQAIALATELGGFLSEQADQGRIVLRIPAGKFDAALERIEALGEIVQRWVKAQDVTDAFRDLELRLRNAEAMRDRLVQLLDKATDVKQSLEVERELDRVSERIEVLKGQLKLLSDRIAYSTITIEFQPKRAESLDSEFNLPFEWLRQLGLQHLLTL
jgi:hypothetical protein